MIGFGRLAQTALAAGVVLARDFDGERAKRSSVEIASACGKTQSVVAKVLVTLSARGLVDGTRGPGGGYWLAVPPSQVTLLDFVVPFERNRKWLCSFASADDFSARTCPVRQRLEHLCGQWQNYLRATTLAVFLSHPGGGPWSCGTKRETRDST